MIFTLSSKEFFSEKKILHYLTEDNPFVYDTLGNKYIDEAKKETAFSVLDTTLSTKFDNKRYPASDGDFLDISMSKPMENGLDLVVGFRKAEGVQEYNNIKTSEQGELRLGISVPVFELIQDMNARKYTLQSASLQSVKSNFKFKDNLRHFYAKLVSVYTNLLYYKSILELEEQLFSKAKQRKYFIEKKVEAGDAPRVALLEIEQQIINRQQRIITAKNYYSKVLENFLNYLNLSREEFFERYTLMQLIAVPKKHINIEKAMSIALRNRPDLEILAYEKSQLGLEKKHNELLKYPKLNVGMYAVHDFKYDNGMKVMLDLEFPLQRRRYRGKGKEIQRSLENIDNKKEKALRILKMNLTNIVNSLEMIRQNIQNVEREITLVERLENVEQRKYTLGASNLFMLNQREIYSLEIKKTYLKYTLQYLLLVQSAEKEMGKSFEGADILR